MTVTIKKTKSNQQEDIKMKTLLTTTLIILVLFVTVPFSHAGYNVSQLINDTYDDLKPQINNASEVVYEKRLVNDSEIYMHTGVSEVNISSNSIAYDYNPQINSGGNVLWESEVNGGYHKIFLKPISYLPLTLNPPDPNNNSYVEQQFFMMETFPQFNDNNQVVWRAFPKTNNHSIDDLWIKDGIHYEKLTWCGGGDYQVMDQNDKHPQINANGVVVWQRGENENCDPLHQQYSYDIYLYDGISSINITKKLPGDNENPQINDTGTVVWENDGDIYRYTGGAPEKISYNSDYANTDPQIINECGLVVWQGCSDSDCEIFLYDGHIAVNISNDPLHHDEYPQINEKGQVVWVRDYACEGVYCAYDWMKKGREIMLYDHYNKTLANISERYGDDEDPQINDLGVVVWSGYGSSSWEIYKATPRVSSKIFREEWNMDKVENRTLCGSASNFYESTDDNVSVISDTTIENIDVRENTSTTTIRSTTSSLSLR